MTTILHIPRANHKVMNGPKRPRRIMTPLTQWEQLAIEAALLRQQRTWDAVEPKPPGLAHLDALLYAVSSGHLFICQEG